VRQGERFVAQRLSMLSSDPVAVSGATHSRTERGQVRNRTRNEHGLHGCGNIYG
jgi:hypothetical protein